MATAVVSSVGSDAGILTMKTRYREEKERIACKIIRILETLALTISRLVVDTWCIIH